MIGYLSVITVCITLCISVLLPVAVLIVYGVKNKGKGVWSAWFLGAAGFFATQIVIRLPVLNLLARNPEFAKFTMNHYVLYCLLLAFTAGLFEAIGRYTVAKLMGRRLTCTRGIAAGLGHGGIEAMLIVGLTYVNNLIYIIMINSGQFDIVVEQTRALGVDVSSLVAVKQLLIDTDASMYLLAGYERLLTMIFHVAMSLLLCYFVSRKKDVLGIALCIACHCTVDFVVPLINGLATPYLGNRISQTMAYAAVYVFLTAAAIMGTLLIKGIGRKWTDKAIAE